MRSRLGLLMLGAVSFLGASATVGCTDYYEKYYLSLVGTTGGTGAGGMGGTGGTGGDDGGPPPGCIPSENDKPVADTCGVFVSSSGDDNNDGTKDKPVRTLTGALAKGATIYACAGAMPYSEAVVLDKAVTLFGGLDCGTWAYDATKKTGLKAGPDEVALTVTSSAGGSAVEDFAITAADAMKPGGSSIAVIVDGVMASFTRTDITAGSGQDGDAGTTPTDSVGPTDPNDDAIKGNGGKNACDDPAQLFGGAAKENASCPAAGGGPIGGKGGASDVLSGSNGDVSPATSQTALGGVGQPNMDPGNAWSCVSGNGGGTAGVNGATGSAGAGTTTSDLGTIDKNGYVGVDGKPGGPGQPGQGGGGGGGAKGKTGCAGASGGGGGAGGCGGHGGTGGKAGGASIGIVSIGATLAFEVVTIKTGVGGKGGDGAVGQGGGVGGSGGQGGVGDTNAPATLKACNGGDGGQGGPGGQGGGGRGGHAVGIAFTGMDAPSTKGLTFANKGTPGDGGQGDNANGNMGDGAKGVAVDVQEF